MFHIFAVNKTELKEKGDSEFYLIFINNMDNMKAKFVILMTILMSMLEMNVDAQTVQPTEGKKVLIAYYSRRGNNYRNGEIVDLKVGNTEVIAGKIKVLTGGDTFYIETVKPYPTDYHETTRVAQKEQKENERPAIKGKVANMFDYDVIYLGYPNWWGTMPMAVFTFLESYDFSGKRIVPFCTHEGSAMGHSEQDIKKICPKAIVLKGLAIRGSNVQDADKAVENWIKTVK